jgi:hypothetical protein
VSQNAIRFRPMSDLRRSDRRAIGFLEGDPELNAADSFDGLTEKRQQFLRTSMDEWISGKNEPATRFHGRPNDSEYSMCFVFKARENRLQLRFHGFLSNPLPLTKPSFQLCTLCVFDLKNENATDQNELKKVRKWSEEADALEAIRTEFPDLTKDQKSALLRKKEWKM